MKSFLANFVARCAPATHPLGDAHSTLLLHALVALFRRRQDTALLLPVLASITLLHPHMRTLTFVAPALETVETTVFQLAHDALLFLDLPGRSERGCVHVRVERMNPGTLTRA